MKTLRWIGIGLAALIGLLVIAAIALFAIGRNNLANAPEIETAALGSEILISDDPESIERGRYLARVSSCNECHGSNFEGTPFQDGAPIGYVPAANLTSGDGGVGQYYTDADWERAIRHGVKPDGSTLVIMPTNHYADYGDDDIADLIAYLKQVPPVDNDLGERQFQFTGNIIFGVLAYSDWPVNVIDHASVGGPAPAVGPTEAYGEYLINISSCNSCHAENLAGNYGQLESPPGPNLTVLPEQWTADQFAEAVRTGLTPDGRQLASVEMMPWPNYAEMSDDEISAIWVYLESLGPLPNNQ